MPGARRQEPGARQISMTRTRRKLGRGMEALPTGIAASSLTVVLSVKTRLLIGACALAFLSLGVTMTDTTAADPRDAAGPKPNRLAGEKSPYLLQHADNPVDWYPWGEEAFAKAAHENKPVFLSIGYATCHWCHVMEHGSGGWPLTIIMTPDKRPFFAATYIPKNQRHGRAGMMELIPNVEEMWHTRHADILASAGQIVQHLQRTEQRNGGGTVGASALEAAFTQLRGRFDATWGGFGSAPKFPSPHNLTFLLRYWKRSGDAQALTMVEQTLGAMRSGGIFDHVGLGFHRYSTDREWLVPHFEKMLYDQALLGLAYSEAYRATGKKEHERTAREVYSYVLRDMTSPSGAFFSAEDADSDGEEGLFYLWTTRELADVLGEDAADLAASVFNVTVEGNFEEEAGGGRNGRNILHLRDGLEDTAARLKVPLDQLEPRLEAIRARLLEARAARVRPLLDDKVLADWNGLMAASLAAASRLLGEPDYAEAARRAVDFVLERMRAKDGRLWHRYREGDLSVPGFLDDYAFMTLALVELHQATLEVRYLEEALALMDACLELFWDDEHGGLFMTAAGDEALLVRPKDLFDGAIPSGSSAALVAMARLARLTGRTDLAERSEALLATAAADLQRGPAAHTFLLSGLALHLGPSLEIVVVGDPAAADTRALLEVIRREYLPNAVVLLVPPEGDGDRVRRAAPFAEDHVAVDGRATAYVCRDFACELPTADPEILQRQILAVGS